MYAVEFQAKIKNGTIEIPEVYRHRFKERVRVILLTEEESTTVNLIDQFLQHPLKVAGFKPFTRDQIYERSWSVPDTEPASCFVDTNIWLYAFVEGDDR